MQLHFNRGVERMDSQLIVRVLRGNAEDRVIIDGAHAINDKAKARGLRSSVVTFPDLLRDDVRTDELNRKRKNELSMQLPLLTPESRLYIFGHGDWRFKTVGGVTAQVMARVLRADGLRSVELVSIISCFGAGHGADAASKLVAFSTETFASEFHKCLGADPGGVKCIVFARAEAMQVITEKTAGEIAKMLNYRQNPTNLIGRKLIATKIDDENMLIRPARFAQNTKVGFRWENGKSVAFLRM
jgi:hypothetical protein